MYLSKVHYKPQTEGKGQIQEEKMSTRKASVSEFSRLSSKGSNRWATDNSRLQFYKSDSTFTSYTPVTNGYNSGSYQPKWSTSSFKTNTDISNDLGWGIPIDKTKHIQMETNNSSDNSLAEKKYSDLKYFDERRYNSRRRRVHRTRFDPAEVKPVRTPELGKDKRHFYLNTSKSDNNERYHNQKLTPQCKNVFGNSMERDKLLKRYSDHRNLTRSNGYNNNKRTQEDKTENMSFIESNFRFNQKNAKCLTNPESLKSTNILYKQPEFQNKAQKYTLPSKATNIIINNTISEHPLLHYKPQLKTNRYASYRTVKKRGKNPEKAAISRKVRKAALSSSEDDYNSSEETNDSTINTIYTADSKTLPKMGLRKISTEKLRKISGSAGFAKESISLSKFKSIPKGSLFDDEKDSYVNFDIKIKSSERHDKTDNIWDVTSGNSLNLETKNCKAMTPKGSLLDNDSHSFLNTNIVANKEDSKSFTLKRDYFGKKQYNRNFEESIKSEMELYQMNPHKEASGFFKIKQITAEYNKLKTIKPIAPKEKFSSCGAINLESSDIENTSFHDVSSDNVSKPALDFKGKSIINQHKHTAIVGALDEFPITSGKNTMKNHPIANIASTKAHTSQKLNQELDNKDSNTSLLEVTIDSKDEFFDAKEYINSAPKKLNEKNNLKIPDENKLNTTSHLFVQDEENISDSFSQFAERKEPLKATYFDNKSHEMDVQFIVDDDKTDDEDIQILKITKHNKKERRLQLKHRKDSQISSANRSKSDSNVFLQKKLKEKKEREDKHERKQEMKRELLPGELDISDNEYKGIPLEARSKLRKRRHIVRHNDPELIVLDSD